jgi:hypothetical protein
VFHYFVFHKTHNNIFSNHSSNVVSGVFHSNPISMMMDVRTVLTEWYSNILTPSNPRGKTLSLIEFFGFMVTCVEKQNIESPRSHENSKNHSTLDGSGRKTGQARFGIKNDRKVRWILRAAV